MRLIPVDDLLKAVIRSNGISQTIETFGRSVKLGQLAKAIATSTDPKNQLAIYNLAYSQYGPAYSQFCDSNFNIAPGNN